MSYLRSKTWSPMASSICWSSDYPDKHLTYRLLLSPKGRTYSPLPKLAEFCAAVVFQPSLKPCALRGSRLRRSLADGGTMLPPSVRLPCPTTALSTLYRSLDYMGIAAVLPNFFFKKAKTLYERTNKMLWRSII